MTEVHEAQVGDEVRRWKPYPAYKDSGVDWLGEVPEHWDVLRLKHVAPHSSARQATKPEHLKYVALENIESGTGKLLMDQPVDSVDSTVGLFHAGDILLGKLRPYLGKVCLTDFDGCCSTEIVPLRPTDSIQPKFLFYELLSTGFTDWMSTWTYGTKMPRISPSRLAASPVVLPSLPEQHAISSLLDRETAKAQELIARKRQLVQLLKERRMAEITRIVVGSEASVEAIRNWQACLPDGWTTVPLKRIASFITSGSRGWAEHYSSDGAIFLRIGNLSRESMDLRLDTIQRVGAPPGAEANRTRAQPGDVLLSITAYIGSVGVVPDDIGEAYVNQHLSLIRLRWDVCDPRWVASCLLSEIGRQQLYLSLYGGTKDGLGLDDVGGIIVPLPSLPEQENYVTEIDRLGERIDGLVQRIEQGIQGLQEYQAALIYAAVTGKIDVRGVA